jgi:hypothetical protein
MNNIEPFILDEISDESLDVVLSLSPVNKTKYFSTLAKTYYPKIEEGTDEFINLVESYVSSFYVEKLYRNNLFFNEKFTVVYTTTGLIRNVVADMYYLDSDLIVH